MIQMKVHLMNYDDMLSELKYNIQRLKKIKKELRKEKEWIIKKAYERDIKHIERRNEKLEKKIQERKTNPNYTNI